MYYIHTHVYNMHCTHIHVHILYMYIHTLIHVHTRTHLSSSGDVVWVSVNRNFYRGPQTICENVTREINAQQELQSVVHYSLTVSA